MYWDNSIMYWETPGTYPGSFHDYTKGILRIDV